MNERSLVDRVYVLDTTSLKTLQDVIGILSILKLSFPERAMEEIPENLKHHFVLVTSEDLKNKLH